MTTRRGFIESMAAGGAYAALPGGFALEALVADKWQKLYEETCVGHKHIVRFDKTEASRLRLSVQSSVAKPLIRDFSAYCN